MTELKEAKVQQSNRLESIESLRVKESVQRVVKAIDKEIEEIEKLIKKHIDSNSSLKADKELLKTIPGIADRTASLLLAEIPEIKNTTLKVIE